MWERERSMREELISVIIPTYNRRDKVTYAVKSVLDQTYSNIEVIIIDDASTDNTEAEIKKIKERSNPVHISGKKSWSCRRKKCWYKRSQWNLYCISRQRRYMGKRKITNAD